MITLKPCQQRPTLTSFRIGISRRVQTALLILTALLGANAFAEPQVRMRTAFGDFFIDLTPQQAPLSVENFLNYVNSGAYDESFFHRNPRANGNPLARFVLQGGEAFWPSGASNFSRIPENAPVLNEFNVSNTRGTVALAKLSGDPNSATNNFFINLVDNGDNLDNQNGGFTVFGTVDAKGMEVVDTIAALGVANVSGFVDIPIADPNASVFNRDAVVLITEAEEFVSVSAPAAAVLPASRSVTVGNSATGFATLVNTGETPAASCTLTPITDLPADFIYRRTNPTTNQAFGTNNPPLDIPAGGSVSVAFTLTPNAPISPTTVSFEYSCGNATGTATTITGVNTFNLAASNTPVADVVALAGTTSNDGINNIPVSVTSGAFVVATINLGAEETITVAADTGSVNLPLDLFVCPTDAGSGECLPGQPPALSYTVTSSTNQTGTFAVFAQLRNDADRVAFDPANNRAFVRFINAAGELRGSTSVALRTQ